jgi:hypothetical protein
VPREEKRVKVKELLKIKEYRSQGFALSSSRAKALL